MGNAKANHNFIFMIDTSIMKHFQRRLLIIILTILLIILLILNKLFPLLLKNILGVLKSSKNMESLDVVIAHYKEDLSWVDTMLPQNCRIFIYTKSTERPNCKRQYFHKYLDNVGRDGHTYLYHIIDNYNKKISLNENTLFITGSCDLLYKSIFLYLLIHNTGKFYFNSILLQPNNVVISNYQYLVFENIKNNGYCSSSKANQHQGCDLIRFKFDYFQEFLNYFQLKPKYYSYGGGGVYMIKSNVIYNRPIEFYKKLIQFVNSGDNVLNGHFLERSWCTIFTHQ